MTKKLAFAIIEYNDNFLFGLRPKHKGGKWSVPGGHPEPKDRNLPYTAWRETKEETGLAVRVEESPFYISLKTI